MFGLSTRMCLGELGISQEEREESVCQFLHWRMETEENRQPQRKSKERHAT